MAAREDTRPTEASGLGGARDSVEALRSWATRISPPGFRDDAAFENREAHDPIPEPHRLPL